LPPGEAAVRRDATTTGRCPGSTCTGWLLAQPVVLPTRTISTERRSMVARL
jgi:hypothetical protein